MSLPLTPAITPIMTAPGASPGATATPVAMPATASMPATTPVTMPTAASVPNSSSCCHIPVLDKHNYQKWRIAIKSYLCMGMHVRVLKGGVDTNSAVTAPVHPADVDDLAKWQVSEEVVMGIIVTTAMDMHTELVNQFEDGPLWDLWCAIKHSHVSTDASLRREAWVELFGVRKQPKEGYTDFFCRAEVQSTRIDRVMPTMLTHKEISDEHLMTQLLYGLPTDNLLWCQFITHTSLTSADMWTAFMRTDHDALLNAMVESANAAFASTCHRCQQPGHLAKECPFAEDIKRAINTQINAARKKGKGRSNAVTNIANTAANAASPSNAQESTGVASSFLSHQSRPSDIWVTDSGASCTMSNDQAAFSSLWPDRRLIRLADGKVVYSCGLGIIQFYSACGYYVVINDVLLMPSLTLNLFAANKYVRECRATHMEITDYPVRKWVNRHTGATEFTAMIQSNGLAYLDWSPTRSTEMANVSIAAAGLPSIPMADLHV